jgi:TolB-like protein/DNA-binding winged helix-turn-helix (wHTH) protein/rhodanese-related sulfurtransferase
VSKTLAIYQFGPFRLDPSRRQLTRDGVPVTLSSRAFEVLHLLARQQGGLVTRDEILARVWRGVTVEENNLTVQISALRRALGDLPDGTHPIVTVPNQGYRLAGAVQRLALRETAQEGLPGEPAKPPGAAAPVGRKPRFWWAGLVAGAALLAALALPRLMHTPPNSTPSPAAAPPRLSIVVLPFRNLANDHQDDPLADAVSDDLTTEMAHMPASTVVARETADSYKGRAVPTAQIGQALNVRYALEGSLRGLGPNISVNAQLIETATGTHVWAQRFEVPRDPPADAQPAIVYRIASALRVAMTADEAKRSIAERPGNPDAMDLYLRARALWDRAETSASMASARPLLEKAIQLQPDFVPALAELGTQLTFDVERNGPAGMADKFAEAHKVIDHALGLARDDPGVLDAQGFLLDAEGHTDQADASYRAALAIDPGNRRALTGLWFTAFDLARWQTAYDALRRVQQIDPAGPDAAVRDVHLGIITLMLGHPAEASILINRGVVRWPAPQTGSPVWDPVGSDRLFLIAANFLSGDLAGGRAMLQADNHVWPHRSLFRVGAYATKAEAQDPAFKHVMDALRQAGLPDYVDEHEDDGVAATSTLSHHGDLDAPPAAAPGVPTIDTPSMTKLVRTVPPPLLIDMGVGAARPLGAIARKFDPLSAESAQHFARELAARPGNSADRKVVVFGDGTYGWRSYNPVPQLKAAGVAKLVWYRGGEEAWARAGLPYDDARNP